MKKKWIISLVMLLAIQIIPTQATMAQEIIGEVTQVPEQTIQIKAKMHTQMLGATSVQYALIDNGEIVLSGTEGVYSKNKEGTLDKNTMYGIGSTSKMFTTAAIMKLVEEGKIDLDTPITNYIPEFEMKDERYKQITVRMLLNHSSGLMGSSFNNAFLFEDADTDAHDNLLEELKEQRLKADPGVYSVYCNDGFTLAEIVVERVSGMDFTTFIHKYITEPLGLKNTKTPQDTFDRVQLAKTYNQTNGQEVLSDSVNVIGTGGIYSTAEELCKFAELFMRNKNNALNETSQMAMETLEAAKGIWPKEGDNSIAYGLGWDSVQAYPFSEYGIKALVKGGDTQLYHGSLVVLPEYNMAAAVLSSGSASTYDQMLASDILLQQLKNKGIIEEIKPSKVKEEIVSAEMPEALVQDSGIYMNSLSAYKISIEKEGILKLEMCNMPLPEQIFTYTKEGNFVSSDGGTSVEIIEESNGEKYLWVRGYASIPGIGELATSEYQIQKVEANPISKEVMEAWKERLGKKYYIVNEKYSSQVYMQVPITTLAFTLEIPGYVGTNKIVSETEALANLQIPGTGGRDLGDIKMYKQDGLEYMENRGYILVEEAGVPELAKANEAICTIGEEGYTRWFRVPSSLAGKTIILTMPEVGAVMTYDSNGINVENTYLTGNKEIVLPQDGIVGFAGNAGVKFRYVLK